MCGRYEIDDEKNIEEVYRILAAVGSTVPGEDPPSCKTGEVFPTDAAPVLLTEDGKFLLTIMTWGFPKPVGGGVIINARSETVRGKKLFVQAMANRRCVIPSTGFYEWGKASGPSRRKPKYHFHCPDDPMVYMAGLYQEFVIGGQAQRRFVILTQAANPSVAEIHHRMPVILLKRELKAWLREETFAARVLERSSPALCREKLEDPPPKKDLAQLSIEEEVEWTTKNIL